MLSSSPTDRLPSMSCHLRNNNANYVSRIFFLEHSVKSIEDCSLPAATVDAIVLPVVEAVRGIGTIQVHGGILFLRKKLRLVYSRCDSAILAVRNAVAHGRRPS